jgi:hypothetical protein
MVARFIEVWAGPGRPEVDECLAFAYLEPVVYPTEVSFVPCAALAQVAPLMAVELLPSSRGAMLLRCVSMADRDSLRALSPIVLAETTVSLQRPDECNKFFRVPEFLAFVSVDDYPNS